MSARAGGPDGWSGAGAGGDLSRNRPCRQDQVAREGDRVRLVAMGDDPCPVAPGTTGIVRLVDDMGTAHIAWDNGRTLGLLPDVDRYEIIDHQGGDPV